MVSIGYRENLPLMGGVMVALVKTGSEGCKGAPNAAPARSKLDKKSDMVGLGQKNGVVRYVLLGSRICVRFGYGKPRGQGHSYVLEQSLPTTSCSP